MKTKSKISKENPIIEKRFKINCPKMAKVKRNGTRTQKTRIQPATPGDEIVISGISGKFPNANNVAEYSKKLYDKV